MSSSETSNTSRCHWCGSFPKKSKSDEHLCREGGQTQSDAFKAPYAVDADSEAACVGDNTTPKSKSKRERQRQHRVSQESRVASGRLPNSVILVSDPAHSQSHRPEESVGSSEEQTTRFEGHTASAQAVSESQALEDSSLPQSRRSRLACGIIPILRQCHNGPQGSHGVAREPRWLKFSKSVMSRPGEAVGETAKQQDGATAGPRTDMKLGRAVSQPAEPDDLRMDGCRVAGSAADDEVFQNGSLVLSASKRRTQSQSKRRSNRSLYGVSPYCKFGPKGYLTTSSSCISSIPDPSTQRLEWTKPPLSVLIIRKHMDHTVLGPFRNMVIWLVEDKNMLVYVEQSVMEDTAIVVDEEFKRVQDKLKYFKEGVDDLTDKVDFIICLGGDGTLLYVSSLFQASVPPVMAFNMGSLGFLTPFHFDDDFKYEVSRVMKGSASLLLRHRLKCVVVKHDPSPSTRIPHVKNINKEHVSLRTHKLVLNEVVVDRGSSSYLSNLDLYIEGKRVTSVQGDGLIISTPTGSTAYAVAAGASMIHPSVPCILLTPICPHSLSFRPVVVPAGVEIMVMLSPDARSTAMVSFDGRDRQEIFQGDSVRITTAAYPVPSICASDQIEDWFDGLAGCLNWNMRQTQRPLYPTNSFTSIDSMDSDAMISSQHSYTSDTNEKMSNS